MRAALRSADWGPKICQKPKQAACAPCPVAEIALLDPSTGAMGEGRPQELGQMQHPWWPIVEERPPASQGGTAGA